VSSNPLRRLEEEYSLLILQYLHLNPKGRSFEQICTSIGCKKPSQVTARLSELSELGLVYREMGESGIENHYVLTKRGRRASELVWDLFHIIQSFNEDEYGKDDLLRFYR
jgi:DNA-binding HxlR family transcriptional regulator